MARYGLYLLICFCWLCSSCEPESKAKVSRPEYQGPIQEADDIELLHSDSTRVRVLLKAPKQLDYKYGDQDFPEGVDLTFFEKDGSKSAHLIGNHGHYNKKENLYVVTGDVSLESLTQQNQLFTQRLYWSPQREEIYTEDSVRVVTSTEIIEGIGLTAKQDFSEYEILNPTGFFDVDTN